jgi:hypothetical protein
VDRHHGFPGLSRQISDLLELNQVQEQRLFTKDVPPSRERAQHRLAVQGWWRADIDEVDLGACDQFFYCGKCRDAGQRFVRSAAPFFRSIHHRDNLRLAGFSVSRPVPVSSDRTEANYGTS